MTNLIGPLLFMCIPLFSIEFHSQIIVREEKRKKGEKSICEETIVFNDHLSLQSG